VKRFAPGGMTDGGRWADARTKARAMVLLIAVSFFVMWNAPLLTAQVQVEHVEPYPYHRGPMGDFLDALSWADRKLPPDAVLATNRAPYGVLLADRRTYTVPWVEDEGTKLAFLGEYGVTHVVVNVGTPFLNQLIAAYPERFHEVHRVGGTIIYVIRPLGPSAAESRPACAECTEGSAARDR